MIGFSELGWDLERLKDHFVEFLGPWIARPIFERVEYELTEFDRRGSGRQKKVS
jgi:hypothetical protein